MRVLLIIVGTFLGVTAGIAQCNQYFQLAEGNEWEMESYNAKDKVTGRQIQKVTNFSGSSDSFTAIVQSTMLDKKGKEVMKGDLEFKCQDGTMVIDMRNFINEEQMQAFQNYEMQVEAENLEIPNTLSVGQSLKDGAVTITATNSPIPMNMAVNITDRKVVGKESITTPAGTFDCFKITSTSIVKTKMGIGMNFNFSTIEWLAPKVAVVKSESYKNGKLQGYTLLTKQN